MKGLRLLTLALAVGLAGCSTNALRVRAGEQRAIAETLYFGSARPGGVVSEKEWQGFVIREITPRFPQGLTSWQASGQWLSASGALQRERSFILHLIHPETPKDERAIDEIIMAYRKAFQQEAVLRVRNPVWISF
jgi:Protein of unknown function (DUF3574)